MGACLECCILNDVNNTCHKKRRVLVHAQKGDKGGIPKGLQSLMFYMCETSLCQVVQSVPGILNIIN
jgi:hypothetical protein